MSNPAALSFIVNGTPAPQGSKKHVGRGIMVEANKALPSWRADVIAAAVEAMQTWPGPFPLDGPLTLEVSFSFPMPASRPKKVRELGRCPKVTAPDTDKLVRAIGDALTQAGAIVDDARIFTVIADKWETTGTAGCGISVLRYGATS